MLAAEAHEFEVALGFEGHSDPMVGLISIVHPARTTSNLADVNHFLTREHGEVFGSIESLSVKNVGSCIGREANALEGVVKLDGLGPCGK